MIVPIIVHLHVRTHVINDTSNAIAFNGRLARAYGAMRSAALMLAGKSWSCSMRSSLWNGRHGIIGRPGDCSRAHDVRHPSSLPLGAYWPLDLTSAGHERVGRQAHEQGDGMLSRMLDSQD
jgi:hypothetical protein